MTFADFLISTISGGVVGVAASYFASKQFQKVNSSKNNPKIEMSNKIIEHKRTIEGLEESIQLKLINKTNQDISDIRIDVEGFKNLAPDDSIPLLQLIFLGKRELLCIKKFDKNDNKFFHNAHRINIFKANGNIIEDIKKYEWIRISIHANCPFYNTSTIISKDYKVETCLLDRNHTFNTGNDLSAHRVY